MGTFLSFLTLQLSCVTGCEEGHVGGFHSYTSRLLPTAVRGRVEHTLLMIFWGSSLTVSSSILETSRVPSHPEAADPVKTLVNQFHPALVDV